MLQNASDAEDMVQGLFTDLWADGRRDPPFSYLYRALTHRCLNHIRDGSNRTRLLERQQDALRGPVGLRCDDRVIGADLLSTLALRLDALSWEILVYRFVDDMNQNEIAELVRKSRRTVVKRLAQIRNEVQRLEYNAQREVAP